MSSARKDQGHFVESCSNTTTVNQHRALMHVQSSASRVCLGCKQVVFMSLTQQPRAFEHAWKYVTTIAETWEAGLTRAKARKDVSAALPEVVPVAFPTAK